MCNTSCFLTCNSNDKRKNLRSIFLPSLRLHLKLHFLQSLRRKNGFFFGENIFDLSGNFCRPFLRPGGRDGQKVGDISEDLPEIWRRPDLWISWWGPYSQNWAFYLWVALIKAALERRFSLLHLSFDMSQITRTSRMLPLGVKMLEICRKSPNILAAVCLLSYFNATRYKIYES